MAVEVSDEKERLKLIALCTEYLGEKWIQSDVNCRQIMTGIANKTYYCFLNEKKNQNNDENNEIILRLYGSGLSGDVNTFKLRSEAEEEEIMKVLHEIGMAPKLLAVFPGGRIEQYITSKTATNEDLESTTVCKRVIRKLAKFHSLSIPVAKNPNLLFEHLTKMMESVNITQKLFENLSDDEMNARRAIFNFPFESEFNWIKAIIPKISTKLVFSHNDLNPNNILIKNDVTSLEDSILFIDYERVSYFHRGYDLAYFIRMKSSKVIMDGNKFKIENEAIDNTIRDELLNEYLRETRRLNENDFDSDTDTLERLRMEVDFFYLVFDVIGVAMFQWFLCVSHFGVPLEMALKNVKTYNDRKQETVCKYGDPVHWKTFQMDKKSKLDKRNR